MHIFVWLRFLIIAAIANATKLDDEPSDIVVGEISSHLYLGQHPPIKAYKLDDEPLDVIVVEDGLGKGWQENTGCVDTMARNGLNFSSFWKGASHGLHSLNLEEIRYYFEPNTTENNKIPVMSKNRSSEQTILSDAPLAGYDEQFNTMALKVMAYFMLNDRPDSSQEGWNTLEKLTHIYRMHEIYAAAAPIYNGMKDNPPLDPEMCTCVNDIKGNGILEELERIANKPAMYFQITWGKGQTRSHIYGRRRRDADEAKYDWVKIRRKVSDLEEEYLANPTKETAGRLLEARPWKLNTLVGPEQWIPHQAMLTAAKLSSDAINDFATFMYCRLNQYNKNAFF